MEAILIAWAVLSVVTAFFIARVFDVTYDLDRDAFRTAARQSSRSVAPVS